MDFDSVKIEIDHLDEKLNQLKEALNIDNTTTKRHHD